MRIGGKLKIVFAGHAGFLATFFVEAHPQAPCVRHGHAERRADAAFIQSNNLVERKFDDSDGARGE
jgi:hypothetical protein